MDHKRDEKHDEQETSEDRSFQSIPTNTSQEHPLTTYLHPNSSNSHAPSSCMDRSFQQKISQPIQEFTSTSLERSVQPIVPNSSSERSVVQPIVSNETSGPPVLHTCTLEADRTVQPTTASSTFAADRSVQPIAPSSTFAADRSVQPNDNILDCRSAQQPIEGKAAASNGGKRDPSNVFIFIWTGLPILVIVGLVIVIFAATKYNDSIKNDRHFVIGAVVVICVLMVGLCAASIVYVKASKVKNREKRLEEEGRRRQTAALNVVRLGAAANVDGDSAGSATTTHTLATGAGRISKIRIGNEDCMLELQVR